MVAKKRYFKTDEFFVLEVFLAVAMFGLLSGVLFIVIFSSSAMPAHVAPVVFAETEDEYRAAAKEVMTPFLAQAGRMDPADIAAADPAMRDLVQKTQDRLLRMSRIPKESQSAHLSFVLLLGQWLRALDGSAADATAVVSKTAQVVAEHRWLNDEAMPAETGVEVTVPSDEAAADGTSSDPAE